MVFFEILKLFIHIYVTTEIQDRSLKHQKQLLVLMVNVQV